MIQEKDKKYQRIGWDEYFLDIMEKVGERGTCDRGRSGCVIVKDKRLIATGYVGSPSGMDHCDDVGHLMQETIKELESDPELEAFSYGFLKNQGRTITQGIDNLKDTAIFGGLWALAILFFFLRRVRMTILIALTIPLSIVLAITAVYFTGGSINLLSLMGFTLAVGMLVDNAVVVTESIARFKEQNLRAKIAAFLGGGEVMLAIMLATLTTVIVFAPLILMMGDKMLTFFMKNIGLPLCLALFASLFVAAVFIPPGAAYVAEQTKKKRSFPLFHYIYEYAGEVVDYVRAGYLKALSFVLRHRLVVFFIVAALVYVTAMAFISEDAGGWGLLEITDEPRGKPSRMRIAVDMPPQSTLSDASKVFTKLRKFLVAHKDGNPKIPFEHILESFSETGGRIVLYMKIEEDWDWLQTSEFLNKHFPKFPGVSIRVGWRGGGISQQSQRISILLSGPDSEKLIKIASDVENRLKAIRGLTDVTTEVEQGRDEMQIRLKRRKTTEMSANPRMLLASLAYALNGTTINDYRTKGRRIPIHVRYERPKFIDTVDWRVRELNLDKRSIYELPVPMPGNITMPLKAFLKANPRYTKSLSTIKRQNRKTTLQISANCPSDKFLKYQGIVKKMLAQLELPTGYSWSFGERASRWFREQDTSLFAVFAALIGVFLVMGFFFESLIMPFAVLVTVPLASIGSIWLLILTDEPLELVGITGVVILIGLVVNNGIVLIDLVNRMKKRGLSTDEALIYSGKYRFRPILMTSLTTIFGLIPMALGEVSFVSINYSPIGKIVIGGLFTSTLLMLFVVPVVYKTLDNLRTATLSTIGFILHKFAKKPHAN